MNRVIHFEVGSESPERAAKFYHEVFGWQITSFPGPVQYLLATTGPDSEPGINGGFLRHEDGQPRIINTIGVASLEESLAKVAQHGGEQVMTKMAIPGVGWLTYCKDTEGNLFGMMQADAAAK